MNQSEPPKKKHGCFFYGCLTCVVLFLVAGLCIFLAVRSVLNRVNGMIAEYTEDKPLVMPRDEMSLEEREKLRKRVDAFNAAVEAGSNTPPLALSGPELNALLLDSPGLNDLSNRFHITIVSNEVRGQLSLPLAEFFRIPFIETKNRYLNGSGTFTIKNTNNTLFVGLNHIEVKGKPLPAQYLKDIAQVNFAENVNQSPTNAYTPRNYKSVEVTNGTLVIQPKSPKDREPVSPEP